MINDKIVNQYYGKELNSNFISRLKSILEKYNIKQTEFAKGIGVSKQTLNNYLSMRRELSLGMVCTIISSLKILIPKFNVLYLFERNQDILLHEKTNKIYDEKGTLINKLNNDSLNILYKMLRNEFLPSFLKSIAKYYSTSDASNHEHIRVDEQILIDNFCRHKSVRVILKYLVLLLYNMAPDYHIINALYDEALTVVNNETEATRKELEELAEFLIKVNHKELTKKLDKDIEWLSLYFSLILV